jgi:hypothetical protein
MRGNPQRDGGYYNFIPETSLVWEVIIGPHMEDPSGMWGWSADGATDANGAAIAQNTPPDTDVRLGTGAYLYGSRSGTEVRLTTSSWRWEPLSLKPTWVRWGADGGYILRGTIQYWGPSGWTNMKYAYPDSTGYYIYRFHPAKARCYRVVFPDQAGASLYRLWGSVSPNRCL